MVSLSKWQKLTVNKIMKAVPPVAFAAWSVEMRMVCFVLISYPFLVRVCVFSSRIFVCKNIKNSAI